MAESVISWRKEDWSQSVNDDLKGYIPPQAIDNLAAGNGFCYAGIYDQQDKRLGSIVYRVDDNLDDERVAQIWMMAGSFDVIAAKDILQGIAKSERALLEVLSHRCGFDRLLANNGFTLFETKWRL